MPASHSRAGQTGIAWWQSSLSLELRLVAACIASEVAGRRDACTAVLACGEPNWILFLTLALGHHIGGLAAIALARLPAGMVPATVVAALSAHGKHAADRNRAAMAEQRRILLALDAENVPFVPLKGPWLCLRAYGDLTARPSRDIDFLVPAQAVERTVAVLDACGYDVAAGYSPHYAKAEIRNNCEFIFTRNDGQFSVEPHWAFAPRSFALKIDMMSLWQRVRPKTVSGETYLTLAAEDEVIMLCVHGCKEEWVRLKWLADLAALVATTPDLDWTAVSDRARAQRALRIVQCGVLLLDEVFAMRMPLLDLARRDPQVAWLGRRILRQMEAAAATTHRVGVAADISVVSRVRFLMHENRTDQLRYVVRSLTTPRQIHFRMIRLPPRLPYYVAVKLVHDFVLLPPWIIGKKLARLVGRRGASPPYPG